MSDYHVHSVTIDDYFSDFPKKLLGRIVHGSCFSWVNDFSMRRISYVF